MRLWALQRVTEAEATELFTARQAKAGARSQRGRVTASRKRDELLAAVKARPAPQVPVFTRGELIRLACASYNALQVARGRYDHEPATPGSDQAFLDRIAVNYLRHELTSYEAELAGLFGKVGKVEAAGVIREIVYDAIAAAYPHLAPECREQLSGRKATP
jgi:hypothetical protein